MVYGVLKGGAMIILVDGYNVLKQVHDGELISEQQRRAFIKQLALYQKMRKHKKIMVVFDGGPDTWATQEKIRGILIVYAGAGRTADDYIHSFMKEHKEKASNMLLVSSDRELCSWACDNKVSSIDAHEFYKLMMKAINPPVKVPEGQKAIKITEDSTPELDELMQQAARHVSPKSTDLPEKQRQSEVRHKLSKEDRALLKKLRKL